jgi:uncharacterized protein (DUF1800 family)
MLELTPTRSQTSVKWDAKAAAHLLSRAGFGGTPQEIKRLAALPLDKAVDTLLEEASAAELPPRSSWVRDDAPIEDLGAWWFGQMLGTPVPLREVMTLFWHGQFISAQSTGSGSQALSELNDTLRRHALGNFQTLLGAIGLGEVPACAVQQGTTSRFLTGKLMDFFGAVDPHGTLRERLAKVFVDFKAALRPVLQALFTAPEFYAPPARGSQIKSPVRLLVGACRQLQLHVEPMTRLTQLLADMGQRLFHPPEGTGWPGNQSWISPGTSAIRYRLAEALLAGKTPGGLKVRFVPNRLLPQGVPADPAVLVDALVERLLVTRVSPFTREALLSACKGVADRPARLIRLLLSSPEYQMA